MVTRKLAVCVLLAGGAALLAVRAPAQQTVASVPRHEIDIGARMRALGLGVVATPVRHGSVYVVEALDPRGAEMRVILDADHGRVVSISPLPPRTASYSPYQDASPRIITILPADEIDEPRRAPRRVAPSPPVSSPRRAVREVVPPRPAPRDVSVDREAERRALEEERRMVAPPPPLPPSPPSSSPRRPRTVLAPPPYAAGPTQPAQDSDRDGRRFAPAGETTPAVPGDGVEHRAAPDADPRAQAHAGVPPALPQIPGGPRSAGLAPPASAPTLPEDEPPPGTPTLDASAGTAQ